MTFTERQEEVAALVAENLPFRVIAERLGIAVSTVSQHVYAMSTKLPGPGQARGKVMRHVLSRRG